MVCDKSGLMYIVAVHPEEVGAAVKRLRNPATARHKPDTARSAAG
jgi:hypothetical protein